MPTITWDNAHEFRNFQLTAEASSLDLAVGEWPMTIAAAENVGNGRPFNRMVQGYDGATYKQELGCLWLIIHND